MSKKEKATEGQIIDCRKGYHPRLVEMALRSNSRINVNSRNSEGSRLVVPRLKHRPDGRKYVSAAQDAEGKYIAWSSGKYGEGYIVSPRYVNPQRGQNALLKVAFDVLLDQIKKAELQGIVGLFNNKPIKQYKGVEKIDEGLECCFKDSCQHCVSKGCQCVWRENQILTWYKLNGEMSPLQSPIRGSPISMYEFRDLVRSRIPESKWKAFRDKESKEFSKSKYSKVDREDIAAHKLINNMIVMQRTNFAAANPYGIAVMQFGNAIETLYLDDINIIYINIALGTENPKIETRGQAKARLKKPALKIVKKPKFEMDDSEIEVSEVLEVSEVSENKEVKKNEVKEEGEEYFHYVE